MDRNRKAAPDRKHAPRPPAGETGGEGGQPPEKVADRPNVSTVKPEDYPEQQ